MFVALLLLSDTAVLTGFPVSLAFLRLQLSDQPSEFKFMSLLSFLRP
jgi:hypothetical protein